MAEAVVIYVIEKICAVALKESTKALLSQLKKEAPALHDIEEDMMYLKIEFNVIKAVLIQQRRRSLHDTDTIYEAWLGELKCVARDAEDVIDGYEYLIGQPPKKSSKLKKLFRHSSNIDDWRDLAKRLKQIKGSLQTLKTMRETCGISQSDKGGTSLDLESPQEPPVDSAYFYAEDDFVGNEKEMIQLRQLLMHEQEARKVISIYGMGGVGKSTLARAIYDKKEIQQHFDCFAWISISQSYKRDNLFRKILRDLEKKEKIPDLDKEKIPDIDTMDWERLVEMLKGKLENSRYLIVLDDMWDRGAWRLLDRALVKNNKGSRVIITTRNEEVYSLADEQEHRIYLEILGREDAWKLFCKKAFRKLEGNICPPSLNHWAEKIVEKCEGLPLAIVCIGSLLSYKPLHEDEWKSLHDQLIRQIMNNSELQIVPKVINLSFDYLRTNLQNCFLYCGLFPEDYYFRRKELIRLWIAEGFVQERGPNITREEVADDYLKELDHRCLLEIAERDASGRPSKYKMHDLVRNITVQKCKDEKFSVLIDNPLVTKLSDEARRVSVLKGGEDVEPGIGSKNIRSFILFDKVPCQWIHDALKNSKLLRVLSLRGANIEKLPDVVTSLFNLHYIDLRYSKVKEIPKSVGRLGKLQMLDIKHSSVVELPQEIRTLTKLRYLRSYACHDTDDEDEVFDPFQGLRLHSDICLLRDLQVLGDLGKLTQLQTLLIRKVKQEYTKELFHSITLMPKFRRLGVVSHDEQEVLNLEDSDHLPNLEWLHLRGKLLGGVVPSIFRSFSQLRTLVMAWSGLQEDPLPSFSHMVNLARLWLYRAYDGRLITFRAGCFPNLKELHLVYLEQLSSIEIEDGAMESINYVRFVGLRNLTVPPTGLRSMGPLSIVVRDMPEEFSQQLEQWVSAEV